METIVDLMTKDHAKIAGLLEEFKANPTKENFNKFRFELQKHLFTEEKAIFLHCNCPDLAEPLIKDHNKMLEMMKEIGTTLDNNKIDEFHAFVMKHKGYEEEKFYPALDETLSDEEKKEIADKIKAMM